MTYTLLNFKKSLKMLSPDEQISGIDWMINELNKSNLPGHRIAKKFNILKELRILRK